MTAPVKDDGRNARTFIALLGLLVIAWALLFLVAMVLPQIFGLLLVVGGFVSILALHYLLWGFWLSKLLAEESTSDKDVQG